MTRISEAQNVGTFLRNMIQNRENVATLGDQISSGIKVRQPGDSNLAGTIAGYHATLSRVEGYKDQAAAAKAYLTFQSDVVKQANDLMIRAKELASQGANGIDINTRPTIAQEVFKLRDQLVTLANSQYQGRFVYGGADDDDPPYDPATYTTGGSADSLQRYVYDNEGGTTTTRSVLVSDDVSITVNTRGDQVFDSSIQALERLGRSLEGYSSTLTVGQTDGGGAAYATTAQQTADIQAGIDLVDAARRSQIMIEQASVAGRLNRVQGAESLLDVTKTSSEDVLNRIQNTDVAEAATQLTTAQNALQASYTVTTKILNLSLLDYL